MKTLRPYQEELAQRMWACIRSGGRPVGALPTGAGKSLVLTRLAEIALTSGIYRRVGVACHVAELLGQLYNSMRSLGYSVGWLAAGYAENVTAQIQMISTPTVARRKHSVILKLLMQPDTLILADEVHRSLSGIGGSPFVGEGAPFSGAIAGATATPWLGGGRSLGDIGWFTDCLSGPNVLTLQNAGFLVRRRCVSPESVDDSGIAVRGGDYDPGAVSRAIRSIPGFHQSVIEMVEKSIGGGSAFYFVGDLQHARDVKQVHQRMGLNAEIVASGLGGRTEAINTVKDVNRKVSLISIDVLNAGLDVPHLAAVVMLRHTKSPIICYQQDGRVHRPYPGKNFGWVFDCVGNYTRFDHPEEIEDYSFNAPKRSNGEGSGAKKTCMECHTECGMLTLRCKVCGYCFEETCPTCGRDMFFSTLVCRGCGYDRRSAEDKLKAELKAEQLINSLKGYLKSNFDLQTGHLNYIVVQYSLKLIQLWGQGGNPWAATEVWWDYFRHDTHVSMFREAVDSAFDHWSEHDIQKYIKYVLKWRSRSGARIAMANVRWLAEVPFGTTGLQILNKEIAMLL